MRMYICFIMTKVVSLSKKAYQTLKDLKRSNESFSDVVLRIAGREPKRSIAVFAGKWSGNDIDEVFSQVVKVRENSKSREIEI
jgi:predicted CopG family antitoxin